MWLRHGTGQHWPWLTIVSAAHSNRLAPNQPPSELEQVERPTFDELYEEHFAFVWRNLRRLGVSEAALWDAAQDVFLVVHRRLADFEPRAPLRAWLYSIVVRVTRQQRRGRQRKQADSLGDSGLLVDTQGAGPERLAAQSEGLRLLMALLETLDEAKREAFVLSELEGLTAPEIAELLAVNLNTVYARIRAARKELEGALSSLPTEGRR